jgi:hypothetical protein
MITGYNGNIMEYGDYMAFNPVSKAYGILWILLELRQIYPLKPYFAGQ